MEIGKLIGWAILLILTLPILCFLIVWSLYTVIALIAIPWTVVKLLIRSVKRRKFSYWKDMWEWVYKSAWGIDQAGSPLLRHLGNDWMVKKDGIRIQSQDKTISYYLGVNKINGTLSWLGYIVAFLVDFVAALLGDFNHVEKAAKADQFNR